MGGEQAASTLWTVSAQAREGQSDAEDESRAEAFKAPIRERFEREGSAYFSTARLWDDGVLDPVDTRQALGLALAATTHAPLGPSKTGVLRM
jgi:3-methylcrotonyl-CoA carboxylase beta subunit